MAFTLRYPISVMPPNNIAEFRGQYTYLPSNEFRSGILGASSSPGNSSSSRINSVSQVVVNRRRNPTELIIYRENFGVRSFEKVLNLPHIYMFISVF